MTANAWAPYRSEIDAAISALSNDDRHLIEHFLNNAADAAERHTDHLASKADASARDELAVPLPGRWS